MSIKIVYAKNCELPLEEFTVTKLKNINETVPYSDEPTDKCTLIQMDDSFIINELIEDDMLRKILYAYECYWGETAGIVSTDEDVTKELDETFHNKVRNLKDTLNEITDDEVSTLEELDPFIKRLELGLDE